MVTTSKFILLYICKLIHAKSAKSIFQVYQVQITYNIWNSESSIPGRQYVVFSPRRLMRELETKIKKGKYYLRHFKGAITLSNIMPTNDMCVKLEYW